MWPWSRMRKLEAENLALLDLVKSANTMIANLMERENARTAELVRKYAVLEATARVNDAFRRAYVAAERLDGCDDFHATQAALNSDPAMHLALVLTVTAERDPMSHDATLLLQLAERFPAPDPTGKAIDTIF